MRHKIPWNEWINTLSINPDAATREDISHMATELKNMKLESYFCFKPNIETSSVCYNAHSKLCKKCKEECELNGREFHGH